MKLTETHATLLWSIKATRQPGFQDGERPGPQTWCQGTCASIAESGRESRGCTSVAHPLILFDVGVDIAVNFLLPKPSGHFVAAVILLALTSNNKASYKFSD